MHPIERLRYVARASDAPTQDVVREAVGALAGFADDPASLVTACRRLIGRHPANGGVWSLCARTIAAADPAIEAWRFLEDLSSDLTIHQFEHALPENGRVALIGWPDRLIGAFAARGDVEPLVIDVDGDGPGFVRALERADVLAVDVSTGGMAAAVDASDLLVLDATAVGPEAAITSPGGWAAAAVAHAASVPVWVIAGVGRLVPGGYWPPLMARLAGPSTPPWERDLDLLPLDLVDRLVGPVGPESVIDGLARLDTPDVAELRR